MTTATMKTPNLDRMMKNVKLLTSKSVKVGVLKGSKNLMAMEYGTKTTEPAPLFRQTLLNKSIKSEINSFVIKKFRKEIKDTIEPNSLYSSIGQESAKRLKLALVIKDSSKIKEEGKKEKKLNYTDFINYEVI